MLIDVSWSNTDNHTGKIKQIITWNDTSNIYILLIIVNKENDIRINTQMNWHSFEPESPSGLHCMNRYGSTNYPISRSSNRQCIGSTVNTNLNLLLPSSDCTNESGCRNWNAYSTNHILIHMHTYITHSRIYTHTTYNIHTFIYIHIYTYTHGAPKH